ncbi:MAG: XRE family transcriptional regulator [Limosilactobacillus reuteri]|nr:XRE family transcriptional regulator [Limosilactobacillus reuteri]MDY2687927.1 XRE family transcriptional regulator [Limosilactobacillus reuteri]
MSYSFPHQLLKLRTEKQLSQAELATRLFVSRQAVSKWENGDAEPSIDKLILLAKVFKVSLDRLILGTNDFNQPLVKLNNIVKTFNSPVLNSLDLTIHNNERIALLGSNGAGKTTLVKIIEGALKPNEGTVKWYFNKNDSLNIMSQENILIPTLKVKEQIILTAAITKVDLKQRINYLLDQFKLSSQQNTIIAKLSGGQKRRLSLLLSVLRQSKLLILDEPTVGMDLESIDYFWHFIEKVSGSILVIRILVITHDFNQIDKFFSRVLLLKDGQISQDIPVKEIHQHNQTIEQWYRQHNR